MSLVIATNSFDGGAHLRSRGSRSRFLVFIQQVTCNFRRCPWCDEDLSLSRVKLVTRPNYDATYPPRTPSDLTCAVLPLLFIR